MIIKKLWTELISANNVNNLIDTDLLNLSEQVDTIMNTKFGIETRLRTFLNYVNTAFFTETEGNNQWSGMYIYMSSYALGDQRFMYRIYDKLQKYFAFYYKFITSDGLAKRITSHLGKDGTLTKTYNNTKASQYTDTNNGTNTDNNIHSDLPQIELDNFEQGIKYASTMDKNTNTFNSGSEGENAVSHTGSDTHRDLGTEDLTRTEVTWNEAMENLRTMLFNDLIDYISNLPNIIYNHYCTDTTPFSEMFKAVNTYLQNLSSIYEIE